MLVRRKVARFNEKSPVIYCDTETTGLDVWGEDRPFAVPLMDNAGHWRYYSWPVDPLTREVAVDPLDVEALTAILDNPKLTLVMHHSKFDVRMLQAIGVKISAQIEDTLWAARVCNSLEPFLGLKPLAAAYLGFPASDEKELKEQVRRLRRRARALGWKLAQDVEADYWLTQYAVELGEEPGEDLCKKYALGDVERTKALWEMYEPIISADPECYQVTYNLEKELQPEVMRMEARGVRVSVSRIKERHKECETLAERHKSAMRAMLNDDEFNPDSPKQVVKALYGTFGLPIQFYTAKGNPCVDADTLVTMQDHAFVRELMGYRAQNKGISTFFGPYLALSKPDPLSIDPDHRVIHCSYNQTGAKTGRFSAQDPNLQQVSSPETTRSANAINARAPFGPRVGYVWYCPDYDAQEARVFADVGNIQSMLDALRAGRKIHHENANIVWGGKGNRLGIESAIQFLELSQVEPSSAQVRDAWEILSWNQELASKGPNSSEAALAAEAWMKRFEYNITKAEEAVGKVTRHSIIKSLMFNEIYGGGDSAAAELLKCPVPEAGDLRKLFKRAFPDIGTYMKSLEREASERGYIVTRFNRRLMIEPGFAYKAVNYMVQGTCADLMKTAIIKCGRFLREIGIDGHIVLTVHDELVFEIRREHCYRWILRELARLMGDHEGRLRVEMPVGMKRCKESWDQKEKISLD